MVLLFHWWGNVRRAKAAENSQLIFTFTLSSTSTWFGESRAQIQKNDLYREISESKKYLNGQNIKGVNGVRESIDDFIVFWSKGSYEKTWINISHTCRAFDMS